MLYWVIAWSIGRAPAARESSAERSCATSASGRRPEFCSTVPRVEWNSPSCAPPAPMVFSWMAMAWRNRASVSATDSLPIAWPFIALTHSRLARSGDSAGKRRPSTKPRPSADTCKPRAYSPQLNSIRA